MTVKRYYYGMDGNITDGDKVYATKCMAKHDINELFYDEVQLGSNSLMDLLNALHEERNYFERKKEEFLSKWSIAHTESIQLKQENKQLKEELNALHEENEQLRKDATILIQSNKDYRKENKELKLLTKGLL